MKPAIMGVMRVSVLLAAAGLLACSNESSGPLDFGALQPQFHGDGPTRLVASKTATATWERQVTYDWTVQKSVTPGTATLGQGQSATFDYTVSAVRVEVGNTEQVVVSGEICLANVGSGDTQDLLVTDKVQTSTDGGATWTTIEEVTVDISGHPVVLGGELYCYDYSVPFTPVAGVQYRNHGIARISNYLEVGQVQEFKTFAPFDLPASPTLTETDATATIADLYTCPSDFGCTAAPGGWALSGSQTFGYSVTITNVSAVCDHTGVAENTVTLTEGTSGQQRVSSAVVNVLTPECEEPPPPSFQGCTPGYWKQKHHFGSWVNYVPTGTTASGYNTVFGVNLFSASTTLLDALKAGGGGAKRLGRHSTAALLSAANSNVDYGMTPAQVIAAVQAAVASGNYDSASNVFEEFNERQCPLGRAE